MRCQVVASKAADSAARRGGTCVADGMEVVIMTHNFRSGSRSMRPAQRPASRQMNLLQKRRTPANHKRTCGSTGYRIHATVPTTASPRNRAAFFKNLPSKCLFHSALAKGQTSTQPHWNFCAIKLSYVERKSFLSTQQFVTPPPHRSCHDPEDSLHPCPTRSPSSPPEGHSIPCVVFHRCSYARCRQDDRLPSP